VYHDILAKAAKRREGREDDNRAIHRGYLRGLRASSRPSREYRTTQADARPIFIACTLKPDFSFNESLRALREKPVLQMPWQGNRLSSLCWQLSIYSYMPWSGSIASQPSVLLNTRAKTPPSTRC